MPEQILPAINVTIHTRIVVTMRVLLAIESVTFVEESLLFSVKLRPVWEFHTPICKGSNIQPLHDATFT